MFGAGRKRYLLVRGKFLCFCAVTYRRHIGQLLVVCLAIDDAAMLKITHKYTQRPRHFCVPVSVDYVVPDSRR